MEHYATKHQLLTSVRYAHPPRRASRWPLIAALAAMVIVTAAGLLYAVTGV